ncbi:MAG: oxidoreductase [Cytophagaceae bacterium SCN 52-12]|nr:MAG: oxidoreductase [Cytophagaceae bacterium SCN 52-12]
MDTEKSRRTFLKSSMGVAAGLITFPVADAGAAGMLDKFKTVRIGNPNAAPKIKFAAIGLNHGHIYGQIEVLKRGGGELVAFYAKEPDLVAAFQKRYPGIKLAGSEKEILEDKRIQLVTSAGIPVERGPLGVQVMKHGKDYLSDKPGMVSLKQLAEVRKVQQETGRIYSIMYSERLENRATIKAFELIQQGAIGKVVQTMGVGPHKMNPSSRPQWFFEKDKYGGIICDIGSHQFDQFLHFTGSTSAEVVASQTGNLNNPQYPGLEDFGDAMLKGNGGAGYVRVDWFTPDGLNTWGDGRLTVLGTEGYMEIRKNIDIAGRDGGNHLFVVNKKGTQYIDCKDVHLPFGEQLVSDVVNRTETAMGQKHCFLATELTLKAQANANKISFRS